MSLLISVGGIASQWRRGFFALNQPKQLTEATAQRVVLGASYQFTSGQAARMEALSAQYRGL
jgi:hypothetical protein